MVVITYIDGIAIWKLVYYAPCLLASIYVSCRHGLMKSSGWVYLTIFAIVRIIGAASQLSTINSESETPRTIAVVTSAIGLSPLLLASLGLVSRSYYSILKQPWNMIFSFFLLKVVQTPAAVALILCIVGATSANTPAEIDSETTVHIGIILYAVVLITLILLALGAALGRRTTHRGEGELIAGVLIAQPFLLVRIVYSILAVFSHNPKFNIVTGSTTISLFMETLAEAVVVAVYICCGLKLSPIPESQKSDSARKNLTYRFGRGDFGTGKLGLLSLAAAAFQAVPSKNGDNHSNKDGQRRHRHRHNQRQSEKPSRYGHGASMDNPTCQDAPTETV